MMVSGEKDEKEVGKLNQQSQEPSDPPTHLNPPETPNITDTVPVNSTKVADTDSVPNPSNETLATKPKCPSSAIDKTDLDQGLPETNVVNPSPSHSESKQSESDTPTLEFEDYSHSSDALSLKSAPPPRLLKAVISCVPQILPDHVVKHFKSEETSRKRKLSKSSDSSSAPNKRSGQPNNLHASDAVPAIANIMVDKSTELDMSDKLYEVKRVLLQVTRESSGVNLKRFRQFSNIFLKNWRFSKQFPGSTNARGKQVIHNMLEKIVKDLYGNRLIVIRGPEDNLDIIKMLTEELKGDNSRIFSQTPPTLTVLVTEDLFDKYYIDGSKRFLSSERDRKRSPGKSVSLGSTTEQWFRLKKELGMDSHGDVASILLHCYKVWTSVACSKCRRHMEVGMEQKTGRSLRNSERSVCIVSCECGTSTSGGFMIECDSCHKWQHGVCVGVTKDDIPVHYSCRRCCNIRGSVVLSPLHSERDGNMSDNSVVSIDNTELCSTDASGPEVIVLD